MCADADDGGAPGERVTATHKLVWADWPSVSGSDGAPTHCLTPAVALHAAAKMVVRAWRSSQETKGALLDAETAAAKGDEPLLTPALIYAARRNVSTRSLSADAETTLLRVLKRVAADSGVEFVLFDGLEGIDASISLFQREALTAYN